MSGLLLILSEAEGERFAAATELAAASAALDRPVAVLLRGPAVARLAETPLPQSLALLGELGVELCACQTSLAAQGVSAESLPSAIRPLGMIAFLSDRAGWQTVLS